MMATEATLQTPVVSPESVILRVESELQDVFLNGYAKQIDDLDDKNLSSVDDHVNSAEVSASGGSDTEASRPRPNPLKSQDDRNYLAQVSSSLKRQSTFKAVSVNKTFLAAKNVTNGGLSKMGDKNSTSLALSSSPSGGSVLASTRPRLIAKSGGGLRDSVPKFANNASAVTVPDPNIVWNKNRPPPMSEPRKLTDEELKRVGIHVANRLTSEDAQGQSNWADIDDDDEDWAPETITWTDGTKIKFSAPVEEIPTPGPVELPVLPEEKGIDVPKALPHPIFPPPAPRLGGLASGKGLVLKSGSAEKPTLIAKTHAPLAAMKSPWAALPPIDRSSTVIDNLSPLSTSRPLSTLSRDASIAKSPPPPAKEIAVDDFTRPTWRDGSSTLSRELFNSQSGRYEPVTDRKGSLRADALHKQPALLQRPSSDQHAETPIAAQPSNETQEAVSSRRRGSSIVSGGSIPLVQRAPKGHDNNLVADSLAARRPSIAESTASPTSPLNPSPPRLDRLRPQPYQQLSPGPTPAPAYTVPINISAPSNILHGTVPAPALRLEDDIEYQKNLMREKGQIAVKRRQEMEAREEAERRERIRIILEKMGPAPERKSGRKETPSIKEDVAVPTQIQQRSSEPVSISTADVTANSSLVVPPVLDVGTDVTKASAGINGVSVAVVISKETLPTGIHSTADQRRAAKPSDLKQQAAWENSASRPERFTNWGNTNQNNSRNVWAPPNQDRALGNGTFNPDLGRIPETQAPSVSAAKSGTTPIVPPGVSRMAQDPASTSSSSLVATGRSRRTPSMAKGFSETSGVADTRNQWAASVLQNDSVLREARHADRLERDRQLANLGMTAEEAQPAIKETWKPVSLPGDGTRKVVGSLSIIQDHIAPPVNQSREDVNRYNTAKPPLEDISTPAAGSGIVIPTGSPYLLPQHGSSGHSHGRGSRFFPAKDSAVKNPENIPMSNATTPASSNFGPDLRCPASPTLPPPTSDGHPAYDGDVLHPLVSLPKPQPVVKLPPAARLQGSVAAMVANSINGASTSLHEVTTDADRSKLLLAPSRGQTKSSTVSQAEATAKRTPRKAPENWQDKFDSLLKTSSTPNATGLNSARRNHHLSERATTRGLAPILSPAPRPILQIQRPSLLFIAISKPMAEECFEEQEMGSLPQICLPHKTPEAAWEPAIPNSKPLPKRFAVTNPETKIAISFFDTRRPTTLLRIHLPGMAEQKSVNTNDPSGKKPAKYYSHGIFSKQTFRSKLVSRTRGC